MTEKTKKAFVISPIGQKGTDTRRHADMVYNSVLAPVFESTPYALLRADAMSKPGIITNDIVNEIVRSDLCVADMTGLNPNVFYELGIAHAAKRPTIHLASTATVLPFDNLGYRAIIFDPYDWHSQEEARLNLRASLVEVGGANFKVVNPVTNAQAEFEIARSEDPQSQTTEELLRRVSQLEAMSSNFLAVGRVAGVTGKSSFFDRGAALRIAKTVARTQRIGALLIELANAADQDGIVDRGAVNAAVARVGSQFEDWAAGTNETLQAMQIGPVAAIERWFLTAIEIPF